jgi:hypothetical protein
MFDCKTRLGVSPGDFGLISDERRYPTFGNGDDLSDEEVKKILGNPKVQEAVGKLATAKLNEEHAGLLKNREEFKEDNKKLSEQVEQLQTAVKNWEGLDAEEVRKVMANIEASEEAKLIAAGKGDEVVKAKTERLRSDYENQIKKITKERDEALLAATSIRGRHDRLRVETALNAAITKDGGITKTAPPDILSAGHQVFSVDDNDNIVSFEGQGDKSGSAR